MRGSIEGWLNAAYQSLIETGIDAVRVMPLAERLGLSRTSFYWFFKDRDALLNALLERWRTKNTRGLVKQANAYAETISEAVLNVFDCWLEPSLFDAKFEFAMRGWAQRSPSVAEEVEAADAVRTAALRDMFVRFRIDPLSAETRARTVYLAQIGYICMKTVETMHIRMSRMPYYCRIMTGETPTQQELSRFFSRHQFKASEKMLSRMTASERPRLAASDAR